MLSLRFLSSKTLEIFLNGGNDPVSEKNESHPNKSKLWKRLKRLKRKLNSTPSRCSQKLIFARTWSIKSISRHTYGHIIVNALHIVRKNGEKERGHVPSAPLMLAWHRSAICMAGQQLSHRVFKLFLRTKGLTLCGRAYFQKLVR